jgi:pSer/pThr/pTyr-binding forkhead associated (FHA) protein
MAANPEDNEWQSALDAIDLSAIESLKKLKLEQDVLDERLKAMEGLKTEVASAVYLRVREDYTKRQNSLDEQSRPLKQAARDQYARLRTLLARFEADHEAVKLDQQELELRHKLGEFDDKEFAKRIKAIESAVKDKAEARARALDLKARFLEAFHAESELEGETTPVPRGKADSAATQQFSALTAAELAEARTSEVPKVGGDEPPGRTQIMPVIDIPDPVPVAAGGATQIFRPARLIPQNPEAGKQTYPLTLKPITLGAAAGSDVRIGGPGVDAKHAQISATMSGFTIVDMNTKHGTRVNAEKVRERTLRHDDVIQIGAARYVFREG